MSTSTVPSVAPTEDEEYRLIYRDKHFAVDGEVMLLAAVLLFGSFLLFLIGRLWLCRRFGGDDDVDDDDEDVEFRSHRDRRLGRKPNWVCCVRAQNKAIVNGEVLVLPKSSTACVV